ncbi:hypothetical protein E0Z10_g7425 [Xylaria hypoxylon]|uniref:Rhodopsin domain-containing protein n=1 Tax=Xylaria hypoxylon TaxID=37992 RepID=A0A4Z0YDX0_9PEZI|nr:hypothetical protein E0Z10_g7425 [Xylaria hypoxylon]
MAASLIVESVIWFAFTVLVAVARIVSRKILLGSFKKFQADDVLMLLAVATDTALIVGMNVLSTKNSNLIDPDNPPTLTPADIVERTYGSKLVLLVEQMQIITIWLVKACLLLMYSRLTKTQKLCVKLVAGYSVVGFIVMEILYFGVWCRPFSEYWAVPPNSIQCSAATNHLITNAVLNISSDVFIILIPMPIFIAINIAKKKKIVLCGVFALGFFTIGAAIANKVYSFTEPFGSSWSYWYIRESSTALIVANIPFLWTTVRFAFRLTTSHGAPTSNKTDGPTGLAAAYGHNTGGVNHNTIISRGSMGMDFATDFKPLDSQEDIKYYNDSVPLKIYRRQEVSITTEITEEGSSTHTRPSRDHVTFNIE